MISIPDSENEAAANSVPVAEQYKAGYDARFREEEFSAAVNAGTALSVLNTAEQATQAATEANS